MAHALERYDDWLDEFGRSRTSVAPVADYVVSFYLGILVGFALHCVGRHLFSPAVVISHLDPWIS